MGLPEVVRRRFRRIRPSTAWIIKILAVYTAVIVPVVTFLNLFSEDKDARAKVLMGFLLVLIWCFGFGMVSYFGRDRYRRLVIASRLPWPVAFIVTSIGLAMLEEAVTTGLTNAAPFLGSELGKAMITASANYGEVVFLNSVWPVFVPWILAWALLLRYIDFHPNQVFLIFGLSGTIAETTFGIGALAAGFWFFVYGLMVYLPVYALPERPRTVPPRWWHYPIAVALPFAAMLPWGLVYGFVIDRFGYTLIPGAS